MNTSKKLLKICLVTNTLSGGGAERVAADLSLYFESQGIEVYHVVFSGAITYNYAGKLFHLEELKDARNSWWSRGKRFLALHRFFRQNTFDFVIDFRVKEHIWQEIIIHNLVFPKFIQTVHNYHLDYYFNKNKFLSKVLYNNCISFYSVSQTIQEKITKEFQFKNSNLLYNPTNFNQVAILANEELDCNFEFVVAAGRMHKSNVKQFDVILETYAKSILPSKKIKLIILGDGDLKLDLIQLSHKLGIENDVIFEGFISNPFKYFKKALFLIMASKYEGFPMVIIEALCCNLPVVSWDFKSGPSEIIVTGYNGILVENNNKQALTKAYNLMVEDLNFYKECKNNAQKSVHKFSLDTIGKEWLQQFENYKNEH